MDHALTLSVAPSEALALGTTRSALEAMDHPVALYLASLSPGSRPTQILALRHVARFWGCSPWDLPWHGLTRANLLVIRSWVRDTWAPATANRILTAARMVVRACVDLGRLTVAEAEGIVRIPSVKGSRCPSGRALERPELEQLASAEGRTPASSARDRLLFALLYGAGLRRAELAALDLAHVSALRTAVCVRGKGNVERLVPLPAGTRKALERWLAFRGFAAGPLVTHVDAGGRVQLRRYSVAGVYAAFRRIVETAGVARCSPHDMRRTYAGDLLDAGVDLRTVQSLLGHVDIATTVRYDRRGERTRAQAAELLDVPC